MNQSTSVHHADAYMYTHTEMRTHRLYVILNIKNYNIYMKTWQSDFEGQLKSHIKLVIFEGFFFFGASFPLWLFFSFIYIYTHLSVFHKNKFNICLLEVKVCC